MSDGDASWYARQDVRFFGLAGLLFVGCVVPEVDIEGRPCPCPDGYTCDGGTQTCTRSDAVAGTGGFGGGSAATTSTTGAGPCQGLCGSPGCGACPTVPVVDAGGFGIDALEVTRGDYAVFLADAVDPVSQVAWCQWNVSFEPLVDDAAGCLSPFDFSQAAFPMSCVDWCDAAAYCAWAGKHLCGRRGGGSSLDEADVNDPAQSEWYAACSAGGTLAFPYGDTVESNSCNTSGNGADLVGSGWFSDCEGGYAGIFDMVGNVEEWEDACDLTGDPAGDNCLLRGGAFWADDSTPDRDFARCSSNFERRPDRSAASHDWGFRCCSGP